MIPQLLDILLFLVLLLVVPIVIFGAALVGGAINARRK